MCSKVENAEVCPRRDEAHSLISAQSPQLFFPSTIERLKLQPLSTSTQEATHRLRARILQKPNNAATLSLPLDAFLSSLPPPPSQLPAAATNTPLHPNPHAPPSPPTIATPAPQNPMPPLLPHIPRPRQRPGSRARKTARRQARRDGAGRAWEYSVQTARHAVARGRELRHGAGPHDF